MSETEAAHRAGSAAPSVVDVVVVVAAASAAAPPATGTSAEENSLAARTFRASQSMSEGPSPWATPTRTRMPLLIEETMAPSTWCEERERERERKEVESRSRLIRMRRADQSKKFSVELR